MSYRRKADNTHVSSRGQKNRFYPYSLFSVGLMVLLMVGCATAPPLDDKTVISEEAAERSVEEVVDAKPADSVGNSSGEAKTDYSQAPSSNKAGTGSEKVFKTFLPTGAAICTNTEGRPVISLFTSPTCSHCQTVRCDLCQS